MDRIELPCAHYFCRGCVDDLFCRHQEEGDFASKCPVCREPLFGEACRLFGEASGAMSSGDYPASALLFKTARDAAQPFATGPAGLNRLATSSQYNFGRALQRAGDLQAAADAYQLAFEMSQESDSLAISNRGSVLRALGQHAEARACWEHAIALDPTDSLTLTNLAVDSLEINLADAHAWAELALASNSSYAGAHNVLGVIMQRRGNTVEARAAYTRALELGHAQAAANLHELQT
jgi:Flp pilus assembly protein TadD